MTITLINPMNEASIQPRPAAPRLASLQGRNIALLDISKPGGSHFLDRLQELLLDRYEVTTVQRLRKPTFAKPAPAEFIDKLEADAVIEALAD